MVAQFLYRWFGWCLALVFPFHLSSIAPAFSEERLPLHQAIDQTVLALDVEPAAEMCSDHEFVRRVSLDLWGAVPTREEVEAFLADSDPEKRNRLIDRYVQDPQHVLHLTQAFDRILMERRANAHVSRDAWIAYLREHFNAQKPLRELLRNLIVASGTKQQDRGAAHFMLGRNGDPHLITRDIGRLYLGRDMQCAQCHDHPSISGYLQVDYHGLLAFVTPGLLHEIAGKNAEDKDLKLTTYLERPAADAVFESVFKKGVKLRTGPRLPGELEQIESFLLPEQRSLSAAEQDVVAKPSAPLPSVPAQSRRQRLADLLTAKDQTTVARNWANRLWGLMFGRGLVEPVDMHHYDNPARGGPLLDQLTLAFVDCDWNVSAYLAEIAKSKAYQQRYFPASDELIPARFAQIKLDTSQVQQRAVASKQSLEMAEPVASDAEAKYNSALESWLQQEALRVTAYAERDGAEQKYVQSVTAFDKATAEQSKASASLDTLKKRIEALTKAAVAAEEANGLAVDAEVQQAIKTLRSKEQAAQQETPALEKTLADKTQVVTASATAREAAKTVLLDANNKVDQLKEAYRLADQQRATLRSEMDAHKSAYAVKLREFQLWRRREIYFANQSKLAQQTTEFNQVNMALAAAEQQLKQSSDDANKLAIVQQQKLDALKQATEQNEQMSRQLSSLHESNEQLKHAISATDKAVLLVSQPDVLKQSIATLQSEQVRRQNELEKLNLDSSQLANRLAQATAEAQQSQSLLAQMMQQRDAAQQAFNEATNLRQACAVKLEAIQGETRTLSEELARDRVPRLLHHDMRPLTPEQLCWSMLRASGVWERHLVAQQAELEKQSPASEEQKKDVAWQQQRNRLVTFQAFDKLRNLADAFVRLYGAAPGQPEIDFFATAEQALYAANGGSIYGWAVPSGNNATGRMTAATTPAEVAQAMCLGYFGRLATEEDIGDVTTYLANRVDDRAVAIQELAWAAMTSAEFRFYQ